MGAYLPAAAPSPRVGRGRFLLCQRARCRSIFCRGGRARSPVRGRGGYRVGWAAEKLFPVLCLAGMCRRRRRQRWRIDARFFCRGGGRTLPSAERRDSQPGGGGRQRGPLPPLSLVGPSPSPRATGEDAPPLGFSPQRRVLSPRQRGNGPPAAVQRPAGPRVAVWPAWPQTAPPAGPMPGSQGEREALRPSHPRATEEGESG